MSSKLRQPWLAPEERREIEEDEARRRAAQMAQEAETPKAETKAGVAKRDPDGPTVEANRPPIRSRTAETSDRPGPAESPSINKPAVPFAAIADAAARSPPSDGVAQLPTAEPEPRSDLRMLISSEAVAATVGVLLASQGIIQLAFWLPYLPRAASYLPYYVAPVALAAWFTLVSAAVIVGGVTIAFRLLPAWLVGLVVCIPNLISYLILLLPPLIFAEGVGELILNASMPKHSLQY
jgi:hypothetical protein